MDELQNRSYSYKAYQKNFKVMLISYPTHFHFGKGNKKLFSDFNPLFIKVINQYWALFNMSPSQFSG